MAEGLDKGQVVVREVEVRLVRGEERRRWDELMERHHYLGFRQFAGRGLRQVAEWRGQGWRWWGGSQGRSSAGYGIGGWGGTGRCSFGWMFLIPEVSGIGAEPREWWGLGTGMGWSWPWTRPISRLYDATNWVRGADEGTNGAYRGARSGTEAWGAGAVGGPGGADRPEWNCRGRRCVTRGRSCGQLFARCRIAAVVRGASTGWRRCWRSAPWRGCRG